MKNETIITVDDIREVKPIALNIDDSKRVEPYIKEAEELDLIPYIGANAYEQLLGDFPSEWINNTGDIILTSDSIRETLFEGGFYSNTCDNRREFCGGLKKALAYLTYARLIANNHVNVTAYATNRKQTMFSGPIDEKEIDSKSRDALKKGLEYLRQCLAYMKYANLVSDGKKPKVKHKRRFGVIKS